MARLATMIFSATLLIGAEASARTETLRWTQSEPPAVVGFRVHWRAAGSSATTEDVGLPSRDAQGVYSRSVVVDDAADVFFTVTAYDSQGVASFPSNEICRGPGVPCGSGGGSEPPPPPPPPPPPDGGTGAALGAITGFKLWNASNNTVIDSSFTANETIDVAKYPCVALEIVGNAYMNSANPHSVKKQLNATGGSCTTPGVTHENSPPYAWEMDEGPNRFACATSLQVAGSHTLSVTPYDGNDCTGNAGATVTLPFKTTSPLGAPGQPFLVE